MTNGFRSGSWKVRMLSVGIVLGMIIGAWAGLGAALPGAMSPTSHVTPGPIGTPGAPATSAGLTVASQPNGPCGASTWCPAVVGQGQFYDSTPTALPTLASRPCSVPLSAGACKAPASFTGSGSTYVQPTVNASNDVTLNETPTGELVMAYTTYTTSAPSGAASCTPARPASTSEIAFSDSTNGGTSWTTPVYLGTPDCTNATKYPSAWDPSITSLGSGTLVLAYVQYNASAPFIPPNVNASAPPPSRLVVSESTNGGSTWTLPKVVNVSKPDPSLTVSFMPTRPSVTAYGNTIYLTWMSLGTVVTPTVVSHVAMVVSTTGGKSWSPTITLGSASTYSANPNVLVDPSNGELFVSYVTGITYCGYSAGCSGLGSSGTPYTGSVVVASSTYNGTSFSTLTVAGGVRLNETFGPFFNPAPLLSWGSTYKVLDLAFVAGVLTNSGSNGIVIPSGSVTPDLYFYTSSTTGAAFTAETTVSEQSIFETSRLWGGLPNSTQILDIASTPKFGSNLGLEATVYNGSACVSGYCGAEETIALNTSNNGTRWSAPWVLNGAITTNGTSGSWKPFLTGEYEATLAIGSTFLYAWDAASCPSWNPAKPVALNQCGSFSGVGGSPTWTLWGTSDVTLSTLSPAPGVSETFSAAQTVPANDTWGLEFMGGFFTGNGSANITITNVPLNVPVVFNASAPGLWQGSSEYVGGVASVITPYTFTAAQTPLVKFRFTELVPLTIGLTPTWLAGHNCRASYQGCPLFTPPPGPSPNALNPYNCQYTTCSTPPPGATSSTTANLMCTSYIYPYNYVSPGYEYIYEYEFLGNGCINAYVSHTNATTGAVTNITYGQKTWLPVGQPYTLDPSYWSPLDTMCGGAGVFTAPASWGSAYLASTVYLWEIFLYCDNNYFLELTPQAWLGNGSGSVTTTSTSITVVPTGAVNETIDWNISGYCAGSYAEGYVEGLPSSGYTYGPYYYNYTYCYTGNPYLGSTGSAGGVPVPLTVSEHGLPTGTKWGVQLSSGSSPTVTKQSAGSSLSIQLIDGSTYNVNALTIPIPGTGLYWVGTTNATVTMPDFSGITVTFTKQSLAGFTFPATVSEYGLPEGTGWTLTTTDTTTSTSSQITAPPGPQSTIPISLTMKGGDVYSLNGSDVSLSNGTEYYVSSVNVTVDSINSTTSALPPWQQSLTATGPVTVNVTYEPSYYVTVASTAGGTVVGSSRYVASGSAISLTAKPDSNHTFVSWVGTGSGSTSSKLATIQVHPSGAVSEFAVFRPKAAPTWTLDVQGSGLPAGQNYSVSIDGVTYSGIGTFAVTNVSTGDHTIAAPIAYSSPTVNYRYVASVITTSFGAATGPVLVASNGTVTVTYSPEYLLTLAATAGGTIGGATSGAWLSSGDTETLVAMPQAGYHFVTWNGTGPGSYSGTDPTAPVTASTGPINEIAQFVVNPPPTTQYYTITVTETGLPASAAWNATVGSMGQYRLDAVADALGAVERDVHAERADGVWVLRGPLRAERSGGVHGRGAGERSEPLGERDVRNGVSADGRGLGERDGLAVDGVGGVGPVAHADGDAERDVARAGAVGVRELYDGVARGVELDVGDVQSAGDERAGDADGDVRAALHGDEDDGPAAGSADRDRTARAAARGRSRDRVRDVAATGFGGRRQGGVGGSDGAEGGPTAGGPRGR